MGDVRDKLQELSQSVDKKASTLDLKKNVAVTDELNFRLE